MVHNLGSTSRKICLGVLQASQIWAVSTALRLFEAGTVQMVVSKILGVTVEKPRSAVRKKLTKVPQKTIRKGLLLYYEYF